MAYVKDELGVDKVFESNTTNITSEELKQTAEEVPSIKYHSSNSIEVARKMAELAAADPEISPEAKAQFKEVYTNMVNEGEGFKAEFRAQNYFNDNITSENDVDALRDNDAIFIIIDELNLKDNYTSEEAAKEIGRINDDDSLTPEEKDEAIKYVKKNTLGEVNTKTLDQEDEERRAGMDLHAPSSKQGDVDTDGLDQEDEERRAGMDLYGSSSSSSDEKLPVLLNIDSLNNPTDTNSDGKSKYDSDQAKNLYSQIGSVINSYLGDSGLIRNANATIDFVNLNVATKVKITPDTSEEYANRISTFIANWQSNLNSDRTTLGRKIEELYNLDLDIPKEKLAPDPKKIYGSTSGGSSGGHSSSTNEVNDIMTGTVVTATALAGAIVGTVKFKEIMTLYETIGAPTGTQASLNGDYALIGIVKNNGKNYYKILDKTNNKIYYSEINDKVEINTDLNKLLEINDRTMMLTSTEIGTSNFAKFADNNTLYFIQNEIQKDNITFANIIDSTDGNDYYVPLSDSSSVVTLESVINYNESGSK